MAGMPDKAAVFVDGSPVFETQDGFKGTVLARYQESGSPLRSGYLIGEKYLQGNAAALDVQLDEGHVVLTRLQARVARSAVRHVQGVVQRGAVPATWDDVRHQDRWLLAERRTVGRRRREAFQPEPGKRR